MQTYQHKTISISYIENKYTTYACLVDGFFECMTYMYIW